MSEPHPLWEWLPVTPQLRTDTLAAGCFGVQGWDSLHPIFQRVATLLGVEAPPPDWITFDHEPFSLVVAKGYGGGRTRNKYLLIRCSERAALETFVEIVRYAASATKGQGELIFACSDDDFPATASDFSLRRQHGGDQTLVSHVFQPFHGALVNGHVTPLTGVFEPPLLFSFTMKPETFGDDAGDLRLFVELLSRHATTVPRPTSMARWPHPH